MYQLAKASIFTAIMNRDELLKLIENRPTKARVTELSGLVIAQQNGVRNLIDLSFHPDKNIAYRAGWILEHTVINYPENIIPELIYLISRFNKIEYPSCQRHYAKMMSYLTSPKMPTSVKQIIDGTDMEDVIEKCFEWMIDQEVLVAVKVFAAETLFNLRGLQNWVVPELIEQLKHLMKNGSAAIQSRGRKLLNQL